MAASVKYDLEVRISTDEPGPYSLEVSLNGPAGMIANELVRLADFLTGESKPRIINITGAAAATKLTEEDKALIEKALANDAGEVWRESTDESLSRAAENLRELDR